MMNVIVLIPFEDFVSVMLNIIKEIYAEIGNRRICYISLNKPYKNLMLTFRGEGMDPSRFFVIDAVTKLVTPKPRESGNCYYVSSPQSVNEIYTVLSGMLEREEFGAIIFDSISTLLVYENEDVVTKFLHILITKISVTNCDAAFICLREDINSRLLKELNMLVDDVKDYGTAAPLIETPKPEPLSKMRRMFSKVFKPG